MDKNNDLKVYLLFEKTGAKAEADIPAGQVVAVLAVNSEWVSERLEAFSGKQPIKAVAYTYKGAVIAEVDKCPGLPLYPNGGDVVVTLGKQIKSELKAEMAKVDKGEGRDD